ncbi:MAG: hypothetical protein K0B07_03340 [DPANN group archaeon]|nr:hypothetical protein [DPANN group archaeon]
MNKKKCETNHLNVKTALIILLIFSVGLYSGAIFFTEVDADAIKMITQTPIEKEVLYLDLPNSLTINLPAVNGNDTGVTAFLEVAVSSGSGLILVNVGNIITNYDTQASMRSAAEIASDYLNISLEEVDITYNLVADASILEGPSAGAAITIATVLALTGSDINDKVMVTGTINHDGSIGPAGRIKAKAMASKEIGAELFLVPVGEAYEYNETEFCSDYGIFKDYCQPELVPVKIEYLANIKVVEVANIGEALEYFRA